MLRVVGEMSHHDPVLLRYLGLYSLIGRSYRHEQLSSSLPHICRMISSFV